MGASVRPESKVERQIAALRAQGATEQDIETFLTEHVGLKPVNAPTMAPRDATRAPLGPRTKGQSLGQAVTGAAEQMNQGATFGISDEIGAVIGGLIANPRHPLKHFRTLKRQITATGDQFAQEHPVLATVANLAGGVEGGAVAGRVARAAGAPVAREAVTRGARLLNLGKEVVTNAGVGGAAAAASAEGGLDERLKAVPSGAAFGAGATLGLRGVGDVSNALGLTSAAKSLLPRPSSSRSVTGRVLGTAGVQSAEDLARADVLKQLQRARLPLSEVETRAATAHPDAMLLNIAGDPIVERAGGAYATPSRGAADIRTAVEAQDQRLPSATKEAAEQSLGVQRRNTVQTVDELAAQRSAHDDQAFGALREHYAQPQKIEGLDALIGRPSFDKAVGEAEAILRETPQGLSAPLIQTVKVGKKTMQVVRPLSFDEAQILKQSHDDVSKMGTSLATLESGGVTKTRAGKQKKTHAELMDALTTTFAGDEAAGVPSYADALKGSADPLKLKEAHELGATFMRANTDELEALWPTLSEPEREFYRKGAIASIEDAVSGRTEGLNPARPFRNDLTRKKLAIIAPSGEAAAEFNQAVEQIHGMKQDANSILSNSKTASRLAQQDEAAGDGIGNLTRVASGNPASVVNAFINNALSRRVRGLSEAQVNALAPLLTAHGDELTKVIQELKQFQARQAGRRPLLTRSAAQAAGASSAKP